MPPTAQKLSPPVAIQPVATQPPPQRQPCIVNLESDGSLTVMFSIAPDAAKRFDLERVGRDMAAFLWDTRGLRHFERQRIT